jgi:hypothetical protein
MTDEADRAQEVEERQRAAALTKRRPTLPICGYCHNCGTSLGTTSLLFCDEDCRDDYEHRKRCSR